VLQSQFIGYLSALEFGYYGDECLEVAIFPGGPGIISPEFVQKDVAQFGVSWMQPFIASAAVPRDLVLIAQTYQTGGTRAITLKSSGIDTLAKLRGKPVAMWDGVDGELKNALQLEGLIAGVDYTRVSQGYSPVTSFTTGSAVAAMVMTYNELAQMLSAINPATGKLFTMDDLNVFDFNKLGTSIPQDSLFMPRSYLDDPAKLDLAKRFLKATIRGFIKCRFEVRWLTIPAT
jgi:NitT/TauT family transport system substrate-binding protein